MRYERVTTGTFISRPNRFIAYVDVDGTVEKCHVKNTGRHSGLRIDMPIEHLCINTHYNSNQILIHHEVDHTYVQNPTIIEPSVADI